VIDSFDFLDDPNVLVPGKVDSFYFSAIYNISSIPQPGINNRPAIVFAGAVVGGGSTVNGMFFDRGAASDYDSWEALGNRGWGWKDIFPYFKKVANTLTPCENVTNGRRYAECEVHPSPKGRRQEVRIYV
jgi:choline dehydrogenase-like flavoprotein